MTSEIDVYYVSGGASRGRSTYRPWGKYVVDTEDKYTHYELRFDDPDIANTVIDEAMVANDPDLLPHLGKQGEEVHELFEEAWHTERQHYLLPARRYFNELVEWQREAFNDYLEALDPPAIIRPAEELHGDWVSHLAHAPDEVLANFWQWKSYRAEQENSNPEYKQLMLDTDVKYVQNIFAAVEARHMPKSTIEALGRVSQARVMTGDVFDLKMQGVAGYCYPSTSTIVMGPEYKESVYIHEKNHLLGRFSYQPLNEAVAEHVKLGLLNGDLSTVDPDKRADEDGTYANKRRLLNGIMSHGRKQIAAMTVFETYMENEAAGPAARRLEAQIRDSYRDTDVWEFVTRQRDSIYEELSQQFPDASTLGVAEAQDLYASHAIASLGQEVHRRSLKQALPAIKQRIIDHTAYVESLAADPDTSSRTLMNAKMEAFVVKRYAERLEQDELY